MTLFVFYRGRATLRCNRLAALDDVEVRRQRTDFATAELLGYAMRLHLASTYVMYILARLTRRCSRRPAAGTSPTRVRLNARGMTLTP